jgi:LuxR family transcriptional regulator, maltose regulon positive regulatory protein
MSQPTTEATGARRHIIKRPRLTRLLDESSARIILLVAPAGYGKTTLAHEWCDNDSKRIAWYGAGSSAADIAALAVDVSRAVEAVVPGSGRRLRAYLRNLDAPERDVSTLAQLLADELSGWPDNAWLVLDDYHHAIAARASDAFMGLLAARAPIRLLLASRTSPSWATARRFIYGEILEVRRADLAMTESEADQALPDAGPDEAVRLRSLADGWPAVIGLAAMTSSIDTPPIPIAETLHAFFAQELFASARPEVQSVLVKLAILPAITRPLAEVALQMDPAALLVEAVTTGFFTSRDAYAFELHPLLREFLRTKTELIDSSELKNVVRRIFQALTARHNWDEAFALIEEHELITELPALMRASLEDLLREGRVATVRRWLQYASKFQLQDPLIDLAEAESALRSGDHGRATFFARRAVRSINAEDEQRFRALALAGLTAHIADDYASAISYYETAQETARSAAQIREALWGRFAAAHHLELKDSETILGELEAFVEDQSPDHALRIANGKFRSACLTYASLDDVLTTLEATYDLVTLATNPHAICGFLGVYGQCLMLTARYQRAHELALEAKAAAEHYTLSFAQPYFTAIDAFALFGLRRFDDAYGAVELLVKEAEALGDVHSLINARIARTRLALAQGDGDAVAAITHDHVPRIPTPALHGEYRAIQALALVCNGEFLEARAALEQARSLSRAVEMETTARAVEAVIDLQCEANSDALLRFLRHVYNTRHLDAFVAAYRAYPRLLSHCASFPEVAGAVTETLLLAGDRQLASDVGFAPRQGLSTVPSGLARDLSRREREVLALLALGLSNNAIAQRLFISAATVKVHVRHIFEKLDVHSRTEAALKFRDYAPMQRLASERHR